MKKIILKSNKDQATSASRPVIDDILTIKGFLRYFLYRNGLPAFRDILFFLIDTGQIFLIAKLLGRTASSAGIVGYASSFLLAGFLNIFVYSMREKILELDHNKRLNLVPSYFVPALVSGGVLWLVLSVLVVSVAGISYQAALVILLAKLICSAIDFYSTLYFFSTYTLSRIYIPLQYTLINRLFHFVLPIFLVKYLGAYAFALAFISERIFNTFITIGSCNKVLKYLDVKLLGRISLKTIFDNKPLLATKRTISMFLMNLQRFVVLLLVKRFMPFYMLEFFAFYQLIHLFMLAPLRISKSMFFDITTLLYRKRFGMLKLLFNYNIIVAAVIASISVVIFYFFQRIPLPPNFYAMVFELLILDKWNLLYVLIFFYSLVFVFNRLFIVAEAHLTFIVTTIVFDFLLLGYFVIHDISLMSGDSPLVFFSIQGALSPFYLTTLLLIYISGIWKKESLIAKIKEASYKDKLISNKIDFIKAVDQTGKDNSFFVMAVFNKRSARFISDLSDLLAGAVSGVRLSSNTLLILFDTKKGACTKDFQLNMISTIGIYCDKILFLDPAGLFEQIRSNFHGKNIDSTNAMLNALYPKIYSYTNDAEPVDIDALLKALGLRYKVFESNLLPTSIDKKVFNLLNSAELTSSFVIPERILLKKDFLGLIPVFKDDKIVKVIQIYLPELPVVRKLLRTVALNDLLDFLRKVSKG